LRASFPALFAATMVRKGANECFIGLDLPAR
jgi:hypothetical protein